MAHGSGMDCDVVVVGAGVAGLSATSALKHAGKNVQCLEATNRIGGRILTVRHPLVALPIELGAEFVHGRPPEIWDWIRNSTLTAYEHDARAFHIQEKKIVHIQDVGTIADKVLSGMAKSSRKHDETFADYLYQSRQSSDAKKWAGIHVEGFNAARKEVISAASLEQDAAAAKEIDGDRAYRIVDGYDSIPDSIRRSIPDHESTVRLNSIVERVKWRRGHVDVQYVFTVDHQKTVVRCRQLIITVPLGVLQAHSDCGAIQFDPAPERILKAAQRLRFGHVFRITFRFQSAFWEDDERFKRVGFLVSNEKRFFTWWTTRPLITPLLTGWMAGSAAEEFSAGDKSIVVMEALKSLSRILGRKIPTPQDVYFHDWRSDPFFRGAYSYAPVHALAARTVLATPVDGTLYFAGEAAETKGHSGSVHGAIASGLRSARLALRAADQLLD
jgi:monoamine oxidase